MKRLFSFLSLILCFQSFAQIPAGYYNGTGSLSCEALKTQLYTIISTGHTAQSYSALWTQYPISDIMPRPTGSSGSANVIWDIYSYKPATGTANYYFTPTTNQCGTYNSEGDCYNREHSFPSSWFNDEAPSYTDYNHIFPTDGYVNNRRSNYRYGEVATATYTSTNGSKLGSSSFAGITGTVFEPIDEYKGDVARAYLYMVTRYQNRLSTWSGYSTDGALTLTSTAFPGVNVSYLKLMLKWNNQDPVSAKEIARNNGTYNFQNNRNPFIDSPQYVARVWNSNCSGLSALPIGIAYFSGKLNGNKINLNWETFSEINFKHFEVERSVNGTNYTTIAIVKAKGVGSYDLTDNIESLKGRRLYYRLKQVDNDGSFTYSEVFTLHVPLNIAFAVYPNPAKDFIKLQLNNNSIDKINLQITDIAGKVFINQEYSVSNGLVAITTSNLQSGNYLIKAIINGETYYKKIVVVK